MKLYVLRHAESLGNEADLADNNSLDIPDTNGLSELGKQQAEDAVNELEKHHYDIVIVSPLRRTRETVGPYLERNKVDVIVSGLTAERNAGVFAGKPKRSVKEYCAANGLDKVSFRPEGGESILDVYERAKLFRDYLENVFKDESILLCSHINFIKCLDFLIRSEDIRKFYDSPSMGLKNAELREYDL